MMRARERLYLTADKSRVVAYGDPKAAFLYAAEGDEIPDSAVEKFGLVDGGLKPKKATKPPAPPPAAPPAATTIVTLTHNGAAWSVVQIGDAFFARDPEGQDTGPYTTADQAREFVEAIAPAVTPKPETPPTPKPEVAPTPKPATKAAAKKAPAKKAAAKKG